VFTFAQISKNNSFAQIGIVRCGNFNNRLAIRFEWVDKGAVAGLYAWPLHSLWNRSKSSTSISLTIELGLPKHWNNLPHSSEMLYRSSWVGHTSINTLYNEGWPSLQYSNSSSNCVAFNLSWPLFEPNSPNTVRCVSSFTNLLSACGTTGISLWTAPRFFSPLIWAFRLGIPQEFPSKHSHLGNRPHKGQT
jgi:hypothetical protein